MTRAPESRRGRRSAQALVLAASLAASTGLGIATASTAAAAPELRSGEVASSGMKLVANLPKRGAFAPVNAYNSDLAFKDQYVLAGNYNGFTVYDATDRRAPKELTQVVCLGAQNDISVHGDLLVLSVDSRRTSSACDAGPQTSTAALNAGEYWEGIRIFDISDPANPQYVKAVETACGSHTHTLVPDGEDLFVYVSSYDTNANYAKCRNTGSQADHDIISIIKVTGGDASTAEIVSTPRLFNPGNEGGVVAGFEEVRNEKGVQRIRYSNTRGCHDITAYPEKGIAAGACMGEGVLLDIRDVENPTVISRAFDRENFAFWHSATFNDAATTVMFTDELGGGGGATCNPPTTSFPQITDQRGANAYYTIGADKAMTKQSYFKIPREQSETENCVAHNGSLVPAKDKSKIRDVMVQAWYQGGVSVVDFTDPKKPTELAWFDRGALSDEELILGGSWSAYYYDGYVYSNDIQKGLDVFELKVPSLANAKSGKFPSDYNPQSQTTLSKR